MQEKYDLTKRDDLHCISIKPELWEVLKDLAQAKGRSISSYIREVIKEKYRSKQKQTENIAGK